MALATRSQADTILDYSVRARIWALDERLDAAVKEYAAASADLSRTAAELYESKLQVQYQEEQATARLLPDLAGKNAEERKANLAAALWDSEDVDEARTHRDGCHGAHGMAEHHFRVADLNQKALRARLQSLAATLTGGEL